MDKKAFSRMVLILAAAVMGVLAGSGLAERNVSAQSVAQEQNQAAVQSSWGALELFRSDLERAGFYQVKYPEWGTTVQLKAAAPLRVTRAQKDYLELRSPDGRETISYHFTDGRLVRTASGKGAQVLLQKVTYFNMQQVLDGAVVNVAFSVGVFDAKRPASDVHFFGHFRRVGA
jgi:hypothetical protein